MPFVLSVAGCNRKHWGTRELISTIFSAWGPGAH